MGRNLLSRVFLVVSENSNVSGEFEANSIIIAPRGNVYHRHCIDGQRDWPSCLNRFTIRFWSRRWLLCSAPEPPLLGVANVLTNWIYPSSLSFGIRYRKSKRQQTGHIQLAAYLLTINTYTPQPSPEIKNSSFYYFALIRSASGDELIRLCLCVLRLTFREVLHSQKVKPKAKTCVNICNLFLQIKIKVGGSRSTCEYGDNTSEIDKTLKRIFDWH